MSIWEKAALNIQKGSRRMGVLAATFSDRVKTEIAIVRIKMKIDEVQEQIDDLHRLIGKKVAGLAADETASGTVQQFFKDTEISVAMSELADRSKERLELDDDLRNAYEELRAAAEPEEAAS